MRKLNAFILAIVLIAVPGVVSTSFALDDEIIVLLRCVRDFQGRLKVRQVDAIVRQQILRAEESPEFPSSCVDALALILAPGDTDNEELEASVALRGPESCLQATPSGFGVLYTVPVGCLGRIFK